MPKMVSSSGPQVVPRWFRSGPQVVSMWSPCVLTPAVSKVSPTNLWTNGLTWVGARDTWVSRNTKMRCECSCSCIRDLQNLKSQQYIATWQSFAILATFWVLSALEIFNEYTENSMHFCISSQVPQPTLWRLSSLLENLTSVYHTLHEYIHQICVSRHFLSSVTLTYIPSSRSLSSCLLFGHKRSEILCVCS